MSGTADPSPLAGFIELARGFYLEALAVDGEDVFYGCVAAGGIRQLGCERVLLEDRRFIGGLLVNADGRLLVSGEDGIVWVDRDSGAQGVLVEGLGGINEMRPDGTGGLWFGTVDLAAVTRGAKPGPSALYHLSVDRTLTCAATGLTFVNGLAASADGHTLFVNESFAAVRGFAIAADFTLGEPQTLAIKADCDGLALDTAGNMWISGFSSDHLLCLAPNGAERTRMPLPGRACTNVRFGGADLRDLYVTTVHTRAAVALAEGRLPDHPSSVLWRTRSPVRGAPIARTRFALD